MFMYVEGKNDVSTLVQISTYKLQRDQVFLFHDLSYSISERNICF